MHEARVESVEKLEMLDGELRLTANSGSLRLVFPREIWERALATAPTLEEPTGTELEELERLKRTLEAHAEKSGYGTVMEGVRCGAAGLGYDLVLRPSGLYAVTTGYHFAPVVDAALMSRAGASLADDGFVEQAYVVGAVAGDDALAAGDENLKALSVRGRRCSASRFEMAPELWRALYEGMGWRDVETFAKRER